MSSVALAEQEFVENNIHVEDRSSLHNTSWLSEVRSRLRELVNLAPNWDSYGAPPVSLESAQSALELLQLAMSENTPVPWIVPTVTGGVQLEWSINGATVIELEVINRTQSELYAHLPGLDPREISISYDLSPLRESLDQLELLG